MGAQGDTHSTARRRREGCAFQKKEEGHGEVGTVGKTASIAERRGTGVKMGVSGSWLRLTNVDLACLMWGGKGLCPGGASYIAPCTRYGRLSNIQYPIRHVPCPAPCSLPAVLRCIGSVLATDVHLCSPPAHARLLSLTSCGFWIPMELPALYMASVADVCATSPSAWLSTRGPFLPPTRLPAWPGYDMVGRGCEDETKKGRAAKGYFVQTMSIRGIEKRVSAAETL